MRTVFNRRETLNLVLTALVGSVLLYGMPFPDENNLLQLVLLFMSKESNFFGKSTQVAVRNHEIMVCLAIV